MGAESHCRMWWRLYAFGLIGASLLFAMSQIVSYSTTELGGNVAMGIRDADKLHKTVMLVSKDRDKEWERALRSAPITHVELFNRGLAHKFQVLLDGQDVTGETEQLYLASMKYMERDGVPWMEWPTKPPSLPGFEEDRDARRADRIIQGWSEVVAYHVDRALGFRRKPPTVGRRIPRALITEALARHDDTFSLYSWVLRWFQTDYVDVALQAWVRNLHTTPPDVGVYQYLVSPSFKPSRSLDPFNAGDVSDVIVFDFLVDDHDRHRAHNWISDGSNRVLFWDNGLAFNYGPIPSLRSMDLLCGTDDFKDWDRKHGIRKHAPPESSAHRHCTRICRFRNSTISLLESVANTGDGGPHTLSHKLDQRLREDELFPLFNYGLFYEGTSRYPKSRYEYEEFLVGMDRKVSRFLAHVELCVAKYGENWVRSNDMG